MMEHIVCISGGKDSAATYMLAIERGMPFRAVTADTGHEAQETYDWIKALPAAVGGPEIEVVRADFSKRIANKRDIVLTKWVEEGVEQDIIDAALSVLHPTGNPFLDLCIWKGRFPSAKARFCTEFLKSHPMDEQIVRPALAMNAVVRWQGERRDESPMRRNLPAIQRVQNPQLKTMAIYRPILDWSADQVFALHAKHNLKPNPLYLKGASRVGCLPCIMENKRGLRAIKLRHPEAVEKLLSWEAIVAKSSKRGAATFFASTTTPRGQEKKNRIRKQAIIEVDRNRPDLNTIEMEREREMAVSTAYRRMVNLEPWPDAAETFDWSLTSHGGKQYDMITAMDDAASCSSEYGLCE